MPLGKISCNIWLSVSLFSRTSTTYRWVHWFIQVTSYVKDIVTVWNDLRWTNESQVAHSRVNGYPVRFRSLNGISGLNRACSSWYMRERPWAFSMVADTPIFDTLVIVVIPLSFCPPLVQQAPRVSLSAVSKIYRYKDLTRWSYCSHAHNNFWGPVANKPTGQHNLGNTAHRLPILYK